MHRRVVRTPDVIKIDHSVLGSVQYLECLDAELGPELVHGAHDDSDELVEVDLAVSRIVEAFEKRRQIFSFDVDTEILNRLVKLVRVQRATSVVVHDFELAPKSNDATTATSLQLLTESLDQDGLEARHLLGTLDHDPRRLLSCSALHRLWLRSTHFLLKLALLFGALLIFSFKHTGSSSCAS